MTQPAPFTTPSSESARCQQTERAGASAPGAGNDARDAELAARIRDGDAAAFSAMVRSHYAGLCAFIASMVGAAPETEEIAQDLLLHVWEHRASWTLRGSIRAYLYGAARNRTLNQIRRQRLESAWERAAARDHGCAGVGQGPGTTDAPLALDELTRRCRVAVAALPPRCREVYCLQRDHHLTYTDIARVLGIAEKTVEAQMGLALKALRRALGDWIER